MGDQQHRTATLAMNPAEQLKHLGCGLGIEVAGGLISQQQGRLSDQRPGDGNPLLLPAGQLARLDVSILLQTHGGQQRPTRCSAAWSGLP